MKLQARQTDFLERLSKAETDNLSSGEAVYHFAYRNRLLEALKETYERLWAWLGDGEFERVACAFIEAHPPSRWTLDAYGDGFAQFLDDLYTDDPEIAEIAWLERALHAAFSSTDTPPIAPQHLISVDWDRALFIFSPSMRLRAISTNAPALWQALRHDLTPPEPEKMPPGSGLMVWRDGLDPKFRTLEALEYQALTQLHDGTPFAMVCESLWHEPNGSEITDLAGQWLASWIRDGLIVGFD